MFLKYLSLIALTALFTVPIRAADQADQTADILAALQQLDQEMAKPALQKSVIDAVENGERANAIESAKQVGILQRCAGNYSATVTEKDPRLSWPEIGTIVQIQIAGRTCTFGGLEFQIVSAETNGLGLNAIKQPCITGCIKMNEVGTPVVFQFNDGQDLTAHLVTADLTRGDK